MTRAEELTLKWLDGGLDGAEQEELDLLIEDEAECRRVFALMELEGALRAAGPMPDLRGAVMTQVADLASGERVRRGAMARIRKLAEPARIRNVYRLWAYAAATLLIAIGLFAFRPDARPTVEVLQGSVGSVVERAGEELAAEHAGGLRVGDAIALPGEGEASLLFRDRTAVHLQGPARLRIDALEGGSQLSLLLGRMLAVVGKQPAGSPFSVATRDGRVRVLGTRFQLDATETGTFLRVEAGTVEIVDASGERALVNPLQAAAIRDGRLLDLGICASDGFERLHGRTVYIADAQALDEGRMRMKLGERVESERPTGTAGVLKPMRFPVSHTPEELVARGLPPDWPQWRGVDLDEGGRVMFQPEWNQTVHVTFRAKRPGYMQFKLTRLTPDGELHRTYWGIRVAPGKEGAWRTVSMPLSGFEMRGPLHEGPNQPYEPITEEDLHPITGVMLHAPAKMEVLLARVIVTED